MRIKCPHCGERSLDEFSYYGDATLRRPEVNDQDANLLAKFTDYVYLRDNPAGQHQELWQHQFGCRAWLVVTRDTNSHLMTEVTAAAQKGEAA
ncbi:MAG: sarcosine oxidase subunit delta [Candidatus Symbiobacter sp.]|nr:sarcosine oxidase subunit delta [Candidatus Symbiobacter sp.]